MKGDEFLQTDDSYFPFVFLDAYDFDHGHHSELRQSRYEKLTGSRISEIVCHEMHLNCARLLVKRAKKSRLICVDDTWLENGLWKAKGDLAVPYLLSNGYQMIDIGNRAVLLQLCIDKVF